ncbi:MAG: type II secretion system protein N [Gammaproteobacteria bacterium]
MRKAWIGAVIGIVAYVIFVAAQVPASWVISRLQQQVPGLQLMGAKGGFWSGHADQVVYNQQQLEQVDWKLNPLTLLKGCLGYAVNGLWHGQPLSVNAGVKWNKQPCITDLQGEIDLASLLEVMQMPVEAEGVLNLDIDRLDFSTEASLPMIAGDIEWREARVLSPMEMDLGEAHLQVSQEGEMMMGTLTSEGGNVLIDAPLEISTEGGFTLNMVIRTEGEATEDIDATLGAFAEFHDGAYHLDYSDNIYSLMQ